LVRETEGTVPVIPFDQNEGVFIKKTQIIVSKLNLASRRKNQAPLIRGVGGLLVLQRVHVQFAGLERADGLDRGPGGGQSGKAGDAVRKCDTVCDLFSFSERKYPKSRFRFIYDDQRAFVQYFFVFLNDMNNHLIEMQR
jgi:hypothetical protein